MHISLKHPSPTKVEIVLTSTAEELNGIKQLVLNQLGKSVRVPGFREGHAPANIIEKNIDQSKLQSTFINEAINRLLTDAIVKEKLRVVKRPEVSITKFVPYSELEFKVEAEVVGNVTLPDYKKIKLVKPSPAVHVKEINQVLDSLALREAERKEVQRAAKLDDEVIIDFTGEDDKTAQKINGADGTDYPLRLGSDTFIPGFEKNLLGLKADEAKVFSLVFPKDYSLAALRNRKVKFSVTVKKVNEIVKPAIDDKFAAKVSPFKTLKELRADIKKSLEIEQQNQIDRQYQNDLVQKIAADATVDIPEALVEEEQNEIEKEEKQNLAYRGQTWQEHLEAEGVTEEEHRKRNRDNAYSRVKNALVLGE